MRKLRLLLNSDCNRSCKGCCNKTWDLDKLPVCTDLTGYDEVLLTGGEPMLHPERVVFVARQVPMETRAYLYTALLDDNIWDVIRWIDGLTVTLHTQADVQPFYNFIDRMPKWLSEPEERFSLRVNIFDGVEVDPNYLLTGWVVKGHMKWIENCPLPKDEVFMRWEDGSEGAND